jgi:hypothetical protein
MPLPRIRSSSAENSFKTSAFFVSYFKRLSILALDNDFDQIHLYVQRASQLDMLSIKVGLSDATLLNLGKSRTEDRSVL